MSWHSSGFWLNSVLSIVLDSQHNDEIVFGRIILYFLNSESLLAYVYESTYDFQAA